MGKISNLFAGFAAATALNILHESLKNKRDTPRIDFLGEQALQRTVRYFGSSISDTDAVTALVASSFKGEKKHNLILKLNK